MARGVPLTPEQLKQAAEVIGRTGNVSEAARAIGVAESTLRGWLERKGIAKGRELHVRACEEGLQTSRVAVLESIEAARSTIAAGVDEVKDLASAITSLARATDTLIGIADRDDRRRQSALNRRKTRAELSVLARTAADGFSGNVTVVIGTRQQPASAVGYEGPSERDSGG